MHLVKTTLKYRSEAKTVLVASMLWAVSGQALQVQLPVQGLTELLASLHHLYTSVLSVQGCQQLQHYGTAWPGSSRVFKHATQQKPLSVNATPQQLQQHNQQQQHLTPHLKEHCSRRGTTRTSSVQQAGALLTGPSQHSQHRQHSSQRTLPGPFQIQSGAFATSAALRQDAAATAAVQQNSKAAVQQAPSAPGTPPRPSTTSQPQQQLGRQLAARHLRQYLQSIITSGFVEGLAQGIRAGDRLAISRSLTLCESTRPDHALQAAALLRKLIDDNSNQQQQTQQQQQFSLPPLPPQLLQQQPGSGPPPAHQQQQHQQQGGVPQPPATAGPAPTQATVTAALTAASSLPSNSPSNANSSSSSVALRIGLSGPPGAGKSSLIETWGCYLADQGSKVAVLAVDPSSMESGGAILGDKTRMSRLSSHVNAYVRPSPARGTLGGVSRATFDAMLICEAAGYDRILVETVGVGQSEVAVADLVDCMMLVMPPVGGDDLQMIKRGIMEVADVVAVNKADGETEKAASRAASEYSGCLHLMPHRYRAWEPQALPVSAHTGKGVPALARLVSQFQQALTDSGELQRCRVQRAESVAWLSLEEQLLEGLRQDPHVRWLLGRLLPMVRAGTMAPRSAADIALAYFYQHCG